MRQQRRYLFGDSTPFPLEQNFLALLEAVVESCVALLHTDARIEKAAHATLVATVRADEDLGALQKLFVAMDEALTPYLPEGAASTVCEETARRLQEGGQAAHAQVENQVTGWRDAAIRKAEASIGRQALLSTVNTLLVEHELPGSQWSVHWRCQGEALFEAQAILATPIELGAQIEIALPADSPWSHLVKVSSLIDALVLHVEKDKRWSRGSKLAVENLDRYLLTEVRTGASERIMHLRRSLKDNAPGYAFRVSAQPDEPLLMMRSAGGVPVDEAPQVVDPGDAAGLCLLWEAVQKPIAELYVQRRRVLDAWLGETALPQMVRPGRLAEVLITSLAAVVQELRARSSSPAELNLKVELRDGRREELFVKERKLRESIDALPPKQRAAFSPFGFGEPPTLEVDAVIEEEEVAAPVEEQVAADDFDVDPVSDPGFDYEPMSGGDFAYEPISNAELGLEESETCAEGDPPSAEGDEPDVGEKPGDMGDGDMPGPDAQAEPVEQIDDTEPTETDAALDEDGDKGATDDEADDFLDASDIVSLPGSGEPTSPGGVAAIRKDDLDKAP